MIFKVQREIAGKDAIEIGEVLQKKLKTSWNASHNLDVDSVQNTHPPRVK